MLWLRLPDVAVIVAVYVPFGVPGVVCDDELPPHPIEEANVRTMRDAARLGSRFRVRTNSHPETSNVRVHASGDAGDGKI
jgi:hypothetical protein